MLPCWLVLSSSQAAALLILHRFSILVMRRETSWSSGFYDLFVFSSTVLLRLRDSGRRCIGSVERPTVSYSVHSDQLWLCLLVSIRFRERLLGWGLKETHLEYSWDWHWLMEVVVASPIWSTPMLTVVFQDWHDFPPVKQSLLNLIRQPLVATKIHMSADIISLWHLVMRAIVVVPSCHSWVGL